MPTCRSVGFCLHASRLHQHGDRSPEPIGSQRHVQEPAKPEIARKPYQLLHVNVLREYLAMELRVDTPFPFDPERAYDDFGGSPCRLSHWPMEALSTCNCCKNCHASLKELMCDTKQVATHG